MALFTFDHDEGHLGKVHKASGPESKTKDEDVFTNTSESMDVDVPKVTCAPISGTPPITISSPLHRRPVDQTEAQPLTEKLDFDLVIKKAKKNKKKKKSMKLGVPATNMVRGFHTPVTSGGEESDFSVAHTPRLGPISGYGSVTSSPALRPISSTAGISNLKQQLEALSITSRIDSPMKGSLISLMGSGFSSNTSVSGLSDSDRTEMESYEVNLENDFISSEVPSKSTTMTSNGLERTESYARKMSAEDFQPLTCLGKGSFGTVLLVKQRGTGRLYAQKQFRKASLTVHKRLIEQTKTERAILESVNRHPFVVKLFYAFQDCEKLYLILEYAQGGELFHHLATERMFSEEVAAFYMAEMILALNHLHRNVGVVYRDLKPENCLLDHEGHLLLTDFGLSKVAVDEDDTCRSFLGTVEYMAPEVIQGIEYGMAVDWWSLGALGHDLLTGSPPFTGNNNAKIQEKISQAEASSPLLSWPGCKRSPDAPAPQRSKEAPRRKHAEGPADHQVAPFLQED